MGFFLMVSMSSSVIVVSSLIVFVMIVMSSLVVFLLFSGFAFFYTSPNRCKKSIDDIREQHLINNESDGEDDNSRDMGSNEGEKKRVPKLPVDGE